MTTVMMSVSVSRTGGGAAGFNSGSKTPHSQIRQLMMMDLKESLLCFSHRTKLTEEQNTVGNAESQCELNTCISRHSSGTC